MRAIFVLACLAFVALGARWWLSSPAGPAPSPSLDRAPEPEPQAAPGPTLGAGGETPPANGAPPQPRRDETSRDSNAAPSDEARGDGAFGGSRTLAITIVDDEAGYALEGVRVQLIPVSPLAGPRRSARTDGRGRFELVVEAGPYIALHVPDPEDPAHALALSLRPMRVDVPAGPAETPHEATLRAARPPGVLLVDVTYEGGRPAAGATVRLTCMGPEQPHLGPDAHTNAAGRAQVGTWELGPFTDGWLRALDDEGNVSEFVALETPLDLAVPRALVLEPGGTLEVRLLDEEGRAVAGRRVLIADERRYGERNYRDTDSEGVVVFTGLFAGEHQVGSWEPWRRGYRTRTVAIARGVRTTVELVSETPLEDALVSGTVLDELGEPLPDVGVAIAPEGGESLLVQTDEHGRFAAFGEPCSWVTVRPNAVVEGDLYAPDELRLACGARDAVITRVAVAREVRFELVVVDRVTREPISEAVTNFDRGPGTEEWSDTYAPRRTYRQHVLPGVRMHVAAHGHVSRTLDLAAELERLGTGTALRIELDPGLRHSFQVFDLQSGVPLEGVVLRSATAGEARSDSAGWVDLAADHWSVYDVEYPGYAPTSWDPDDFVLYHWGPLELWHPTPAGEGDDR